MSTLALRDAIADVIGAHQIAPGLPMFPKVLKHAGRWGIEELKRYAAQAPCAVVAWLGTPNAGSQGGQVTGLPRFSIVVFTRDTGAGDALKRDAHLMNLLDEIAKVVVPNRWNGKAAGKPENVVVENNYSTEIDRLAFTIGAVTWQQRVDLVGNTDADLDQFLKLHADWLKVRESVAGSMEPTPPPGVYDATDESTFTGGP